MIKVVPDSYKSAVGLEICGDRACVITGKTIVMIKDKEVAIDSGCFSRRCEGSADRFKPSR